MLTTLICKTNEGNVVDNKQISAGASEACNLHALNNTLLNIKRHVLFVCT
jgi:hypothetical protein